MDRTVPPRLPGPSAAQAAPRYPRMIGDIRGEQSTGQDEKSLGSTANVRAHESMVGDRRKFVRGATETTANAVAFHAIPAWRLPGRARDRARLRALRREPRLPSIRQRDGAG